MIDDFLLPAAANPLGLLVNVLAETARGCVILNHEAALSLFGPAQTTIVLGVGLLSLAIWRARLLNLKE